MSERALILEGSQAAPVCPSDKSNMWMNMGMEHCWNDTDRAKPVQVLLCPPKILDGLISYRNRASAVRDQGLTV